jgi:hypothetical protein
MHRTLPTPVDDAAFRVVRHAPAAGCSDMLEITALPWQLLQDPGLAAAPHIARPASYYCGDEASCGWPVRWREAARNEGARGHVAMAVVKPRKSPVQTSIALVSQRHHLSLISCAPSAARF